MKRFNKILCVLSALSFVLSLAGCNITDQKPAVQTTSQVKTTTQTTTSSTTAASTTASAQTTVTTTKKPVTTTAKKTTTTTTAAGYPYAYAGFDPVETDMSAPFNLILLNRNYRLPDGYVPPKLETVVEGSSEKLDSRVAGFYRQMYNAALADGITLTPVSGYRSVARQKRNFENRIAMYEKQGLNKVDATVKASQIVLLPGTSEHNAGLAMDICSLSVSFENTAEFRWLDAHAHKYGFILRYPKDKTHITNITYEPWHYRYVGVEVATELKTSGMVLEEYIGA